MTVYAEELEEAKVRAAADARKPYADEILRLETRMNRVWEVLNFQRRINKALLEKITALEATLHWTDDENAAQVEDTTFDGIKGVGLGIKLHTDPDHRGGAAWPASRLRRAAGKAGVRAGHASRPPGSGDEQHSDAAGHVPSLQGAGHVGRRAGLPHRDGRRGE